MTYVANYAGAGQQSKFILSCAQVQSVCQSEAKTQGGPNLVNLIADLLPTTILLAIITACSLLTVLTREDKHRPIPARQDKRSQAEEALPSSPGDGHTVYTPWGLTTVLDQRPLSEARRQGTPFNDLRSVAFREGTPTARQKVCSERQCPGIRGGMSGSRSV